MMEQEIASLIRFVLEASGNPAPYYDETPEDFMVPAVFFPPPEITSSGDTLASYAFRYEWFIMFFHRDTPSAYGMAQSVLTALQDCRRVVPLYTEAGEFVGKKLRVRDPLIKKAEDAPGAVQLQISWDSRRPYGE
ncbi:MAG: hypothetical protein LBR72_02595 [Oscillospiraceae bacterium]|jgi:hypothetical protein|nr:hypothetical protein [Oscillospiraceae bacterium]